MARVVLETIGLTKRYGGVVASDHVDFSLKSGELRCLIGPNGAGKSTFLKCISGLVAPTEGQVYMNGIETTSWLPHQIARLGVGIKTQVPNVFDALSVEENLWVAARRVFDKQECKDRVQHTISRLSLGQIARAPLGQLAHGERQRVELGMVVISDPWLVLLDEPAAGMSAEDLDRMRDILEDITTTSAVIVVEHDMQFVRSIANKVTVFHQGAVLIEDHVDVVLNDPEVRDVYLGKSHS